MIRPNTRVTRIYTADNAEATWMVNSDLEILIDHLDLARSMARCNYTNLKPGDAFALQILQTHFNHHVYDEPERKHYSGSEQEFLGN